MKKERIKAKIKRVKQKLLTCLPEKETKLRSKLANLKLMLKEERKLTTLLLFYVYVEPEWSAAEFEDAQKWAFENASLLGITGRLRVAREGFNGTMTGSFKNMRKWCNALRDWKPLVFENVQFKLTDGLPTGQMFPQLKVFPVTELVNYGLEGKQPSLKKGGTHLEPLEFHKKLEEPNTVVIDVRNSYEAEIGHFVPPDGGAKYIDPEMRVSTEFPLWVDQHKKELEGKQIMMFCTGGIRCERASALLGEKGLNNVYQMRGGIHRYLEEFPVDGGHWKGQNYTFDKRFAHGPQETVTLGHCAACEKPYDKYRGKKRCKCGVPLLICEDCQNLHPDTLCKLCKREMVTVNPKAFKKAIAKPKARTPDCGVCGLQFNSRNAMFKHLKESGHMDRKAKKRAA